MVAADLNDIDMVRLLLDTGVDASAATKVTRA